MIYLKNNTETQSIYIPRQTVLGGGYIATTKTYEDGYNDGLEDGKKQQKDKLLNLYVTENGQYEREDGWDVVTVDIPTEGGSCNLGEGALTLNTKDIGIYELNASDGGYDGWSKFVVELEEVKPIPPQDGWGMVGYFNSWGGTPDIPFEENGEWEGRPYKVIRGFEAVQSEFKIRRNSAWADSYTADFSNEPQFAKLVRGDWNMPIDDGLWDIYLFFRDNGKPNEMLLLHSGTDLSTIKYEYTLTISTDKENAVFLIGDSFDFSAKKYYGGSATIPMKYGCIYSINVFMEGYEDIFEEITCYNDEERSYTLTKIEGYGCNLINPIVFSKEAGNTINVENVQIPAFVYEGNQYYNVGSFNLADIEEFKIHILFKPNNSGDAEPINVFGCEDSDWDNTTFGARIYQGQIYFRMGGEDAVYSYTENTWYDVEMGYNTSKKWVIVNGETLLDAEYASYNRPSQTLMIGAINSGGNAFRPFYGKIAAIYIESNRNQVWLLPKENGSMNVYWNNRINSRNSISGENNARFENDSISGDGMKSITWLGNLEDKWVTPSMSERDGNGYIVVSPSEGYNGLSRTVINPQTLYNEGLEAGRTEKETDIAANARVLNVTENGVYKSKFSDKTIIAEPTGIYENGDLFFDYAYLKNIQYNTNIYPMSNTKMEIWWKYDGSKEGNEGCIVGCQNWGYINSIFKIGWSFGDNRLLASINDDTIFIPFIAGWNHIVMSYADGLWLNGTKIGNFPSNITDDMGNKEPICINGYYGNTRMNSDYFGMVKINDVVFIPTENGFLNTSTNELLPIHREGEYTYTSVVPEYDEPTGELYKTINVNVPQEVVSCNLEEKQVTPSTNDVDDNGYIIINPDNGYDAMSRVSINVSTIKSEWTTIGKNSITDYDTTAFTYKVNNWTSVNINRDHMTNDCNNRPLDCLLFRNRNGECTVMTKLDTCSGVVRLENGWNGDSVILSLKSSTITKFSSNSINSNQLKSIDTGFAQLEGNAITNCSALTDIKVTVINNDLSNKFAANCFNGLPAEGTITVRKSGSAVTLTNDEITSFFRTIVGEGWTITIK